MPKVAHLRPGVFQGLIKMLHHCQRGKKGKKKRNIELQKKIAMLKFAMFNSITKMFEA
jgi:hypothetical protein